MTERQRPGRLQRGLATIVYRLIVLVLTIAILFFGYRTVEAVLRYVDEQTRYTASAPGYPLTATAIAPTLITHTPEPTATATATPIPSETPTETASPTASATATASDTPTATATATDTPTETEAPATATDIPPTATEVALGGAPRHAQAKLAQAFVTNTPQPQDASQVTLPPVNTPSAPVEPSMPASTPTLAASPVPESGGTPRPLPTVFVYGNAPEGVVAPTGVPTAVEFVDRQGYDLFNVVLLGNDGELTNDGFIRTDTMIIVSINRTTGTVSMIGLPRDLYVYIPGWTMQRLNLAYIHGQSVGWTDGGFGLLRQTILYNFGINVHYYAMVNLSGLRNLIDMVGGVDIAVDCAIQNLPLIGADVPAAAQRVTEEGDYLLPVGVYHLTGGEALWYARARDITIEFDRQRRQMQLLRALWRKARDNGLLVNLPALWQEGSQFVETNLTLEDLLGLVPVALNLDVNNIENFNLIRLYHTEPWQTPDGEYVQLPIYDTMRPLLEDFYSPPTDSQVRVEGARIRVYNGSPNADWDRVAAERLAYSGFLANAAGAADNNAYTDTVLVDYTGSSKGSSLQDIAHILNVRPENIRIEPDPNREVDFDVILGANYNSCTEPGVQQIN